VAEFTQYVNVNEALKRIGGSMDLYKRLLTQFLNGDYVEPLELALSSGDSEEASRRIHSLKGVCANLSLVRLTTASVDLENIIHDGAEYTESLAELKRIYSETSAQISEII
jgi:HPt (histidine-containing phosphotransfer) domain-containing protein